MPSDPSALMKLAVAVNGFHGDNLAPWHVKAAYQTFADKGKPMDQGVFEEWWSAPDKYHVSFTGPGLAEQRYVTKSGTFFVGGEAKPWYQLDLISPTLLQPLPGAAMLKDMDVLRSKMKLDKVPLQCLRLNPRQEPGTNVLRMTPIASYCFGEDSPALQLEKDLARVTRYEDIVQLQGQYLARRIRMINGEMPMINIDVIEADAPGAILEANFTPPANATAAPAAPPAALPTVVVVIRSDSPSYPSAARAHNVQGIVIIAGTLAVNGKIDGARLISGPAELQSEALAETKTLRLPPHKVNGHAVDLPIQLKFIFLLTGR
jgi:hypothetical protein